MRHLLSVILFLFYSFSCFAQKKMISGSVKDINNQFVPYANIVVNDTSTPPQPLGFVSSDEKGNFSIQIPTKITKVIINATAIGFDEKSVVFMLDTIQYLIIYLDTNVTMLQEVVVKSRKSSDTLDVGIDSMNFSKDATLRDILNKTDGVIVSKEGGISYQGKQINKVLINGKEVFINQNKIALDNLNYELMDNVQIINNYKDKFTIDFNKIREPVINVKTKSSFKGVLKSQLDLGYGFSNSYSFNGKGFFFSDKLNAFATSHTNNIGQKELSQRDIAASIVEHTSGSLSNILFPFFTEDNRMKKNFASNSSLTLRWQGNKSKAGLVFYHGNVNTKQEIEYNIFMTDTLLKKSNLTSSIKGDFFAATANYSTLLSSKTVLQNVLSFVVVQQKQHKENADTLFTLPVTNFLEQTNDAPKTLTIANAFKLTTLLRSNAALDVGIDFYNETNIADFNTEVIYDNIISIFQKRKFSKEYLSAYSNLKLRLKNNMSFYGGISISQNNEAGKLKTKYNIVSEDDILERKFIALELPFSLQGSYSKWDYSFKISPVFINGQNFKSHGFLSTANSVTYNFEPQNNITLTFNRNYLFFDINTLYDTLLQTYNSKTINDTESINQLSAKEELSLNWFNTNTPKARMTYFIYRLSREKNFLQTVLKAVSDNTFYYYNRVFDKKYTHTINAGSRKSFYLEPTYHRLDISGGLMYVLDSYKTIINEKNVQASSVSWQPTFAIGFVPRNFFIKEITGHAQWRYFTFNIDNEEVSWQRVLTNTLSFESVLKKVEWKFDFEYSLYNINQTKFNVPDCNLTFKYSISDKLAISAKGKSLLTLCRLNNYAFANTLSQGNILTQISTNNNLAYLLFYLNIKI